MRLRREATAPSETVARTATAAPTPAPASTAASPMAAELLMLQRSAGNQAVAGLIQRATAPQIATAKETADADFAAGRIGSYFTGNFLANHIEEASAGAKKEADNKSTSTKQARSQAYKKLEERADTDAGGSGWGPGKKMTGTNTLILDYGPQKKHLMRAVNVEAIDNVEDEGHPYIHPVTEERMKTVTYSSSGEKSEKTGKVEMGAKFEDGRYKINHLGGVS
jgi:hypothetical protein